MKRTVVACNQQVLCISLCFRSLHYALKGMQFCSAAVRVDTNRDEVIVTLT